VLGAKFCPLVTAWALPSYRILHLGPPFSTIPLWMPLSKVSMCLTVRTPSKALLGSQTHRRDRDFSWVRKPVSLTCSEVFQKCEIDTETQTTELHFTQLLPPQAPETPLPAARARRQTSARCASHLPRGEGESHHRRCGNRTNRPSSR